MALPSGRIGCHYKQRFQHVKDAEALVAYLRSRDRQQSTLNVYWCVAHRCWHVGHRKNLAFGIRKTDWSTTDALALSERLRRELIEQYGASLDRRVWDGVAILTGVLKHLHRPPKKKT